MYAVMRERRYKPGQWISNQERDGGEAIMATVPGYYGQLTVEIGDGWYVRIAVWEPEEGRTAVLDREECRRHAAWAGALIGFPDIGRGDGSANTLLQT